MSYFTCNQITKNYNSHPVVQNISLTIEQGKLVCLLGPSGGGKSTLMSILSGVDPPDSGQVILAGKDITGLPGNVSYMLQKDLLLPYKTILDNASLPLLLNGKNRAEAHKITATLFESFGLAGCEKKYPHQLSGGMRQRAALLRTYMTGKDVMLLDEPFSALDAITKRQMHVWYLDIVRKLGSTTLLITHDVDEALLLADRIYILAGVPGQITFQTNVHAPHPRLAEFSVSKEFLKQKRQIFSAIEQ